MSDYIRMEDNVLMSKKDFNQLLVDLDNEYKSNAEIIRMFGCDSDECKISTNHLNKLEKQYNNEIKKQELYKKQNNTNKMYK